MKAFFKIVAKQDSIASSQRVVAPSDFTSSSIVGDKIHVLNQTSTLKLCNYAWDNLIAFDIHTIYIIDQLLCA